jgi:hypothetical protein
MLHPIPDAASSPLVNTASMSVDDTASEWRIQTQDAGVCGVIPYRQASSISLSVLLIDQGICSGKRRILANAVSRGFLRVWGLGVILYARRRARYLMKHKPRVYCSNCTLFVIGTFYGPR